MGKIAIVTDSTADLNAEQVQKYNITVVPLNVHFHDEVFKDGVDITTASFFKKLKESRVPPRTSQPSPGDFHKVYKSLLSAGFQSIISIHISSDLSGTWQSASIARDMLPEEQIQVINSKSASMGIGLIVINTVNKIQEGASQDEAVAYANKLIDQTRIMFGVDTLEYLHRNGRIGAAAKLMGGLLNVKPMLVVDNGVVAPLGKVRGKNKVIPFLMEQAEKFIGDYDGPVDLAVVHAQDPAIAQEITARVTEKLKIRDVYQSEIGSVIGTHTGPGTVGIILQKC